MIREIGHFKPEFSAYLWSESAAILFTAKVTRSVKREIRVDTFRGLPLQCRHSNDQTRRYLVINTALRVDSMRDVRRRRLSATPSHGGRGRVVRSIV
jgi:hypothetical protein